MKRFIRTGIEQILIGCAKLILARHRPKIIAMTGSSGKTTTKYVIGMSMVEAFGDKKVRIGYGNLNTKIGIPLAILNIQVSFIDLSSFFMVLAWIAVVPLALVKTIIALIWPRFPEYIVLEVCADRPGDIPASSRYLRPDVAVITNVSPVHLSHFSDFDHLVAEKRALIEFVPKDGLVLLNGRDENVRAMASKTKATVVTLDVSPVSFAREVAYQVIARYGAARDVVDHALEKIVLPKGRFDVLQGKNDTILVDSSYNASPASMRFAFEKIYDMTPKGRKIFVLGDMLELGSETKKAHEVIGQEARAQSDYLVTVGPESRHIPSDYWTMSPREAGEHVLSLMQPGDTILVKASHGMHLHTVVTMLER